MNKSFTYVMAGLVIGVVLGLASYYSIPDKATAADVAKYMAMISTTGLWQAVKNIFTLGRAGKNK